MARLMHRWFVQYNPLFLASALFVLGGVFLLTRDPLDWDTGQFALASVIQLYELVLIAGAGFLFNLPGQRRPAVILGITAMVFLFDVTFRSEALASVGVHMLAASIAWAMLLAVKLAMIGHALRVRLPLAHCVLWTLGGLAVALAPQLIASGIVDPALVLTGACWLGIALAAVTLWGVPRVPCEVALDDWGRTVLARAVGYAPALWTALYWTHVVTWCGIYELKLAPACFAPALVLLPLVLRSEGAVWMLCAVVLAVAAGRPEFAHVAVLLALGLAIKAYRAGWPSLYIAAALAGALPGVVSVLPGTLAEWGATLLGAGFVSLVIGIALNWWSSREGAIG